MIIILLFSWCVVCFITTQTRKCDLRHQYLHGNSEIFSKWRITWHHHCCDSGETYGYCRDGQNKPPSFNFSESGHIKNSSQKASVRYKVYHNHLKCLECIPVRFLSLVLKCYFCTWYLYYIVTSNNILPNNGVILKI